MNDSCILFVFGNCSLLFVRGEANKNAGASSDRCLRVRLKDFNRWFDSHTNFLFHFRSFLTVKGAERLIPKCTLYLV